MWEIIPSPSIQIHLWSNDLCVFLLLTSPTLDHAVGFFDWRLIDEAGILRVTGLQDVRIWLLTSYKTNLQLSFKINCAISFILFQQQCDLNNLDSKKKKMSRLIMNNNMTKSFSALFFTHSTSNITHSDGDRTHMHGIRPWLWHVKMKKGYRMKDIREKVRKTQEHPHKQARNTNEWWNDGITLHWAFSFTHTLRKGIWVPQTVDVEVQ